MERTNTKQPKKNDNKKIVNNLIKKQNKKINFEKYK